MRRVLLILCVLVALPADLRTGGHTCVYSIESLQSG